MSPHCLVKYLCSKNRSAQDANRRWLCAVAEACLTNSDDNVGTGVNPAGDTSHQYFGWGETSTRTSPQYYYVLSDIADQYWLPSVRSASSRFHSAVRRVFPPTLQSIRWFVPQNSR